MEGECPPVWWFPAGTHSTLPCGRLHTCVAQVSLLCQGWAINMFVCVLASPGKDCSHLTPTISLMLPRMDNRHSHVLLQAWARIAHTSSSTTAKQRERSFGEHR
eukprot:1158768-Pelagomonas_calceolata.AAC.4